MAAIGKRPYGQEKDSNFIHEIVSDPIDRINDSVTGMGGALLTGDFDTLGGEANNISKLLDDLLNGRLNDDLLRSGSNKLLEDLGLREGGYVTFDNMPVHVEPGSVVIQPKLNIAETEMYLDPDQGESYTYVQWLNTTGVKINMTIYNRMGEKPQAGTEKSSEGSTKYDSSLWDVNTTVNDVLLRWARGFYKFELWMNFGIREIKGPYFIYDIKQTIMNHEIIKSEVELHSYTQGKMEDTFYKNYALNDLVGRDLSGDTGLASRLEQAPELKKECNCTPPSNTTTPSSNNTTPTNTTSPTNNDTGPSVDFMSLSSPPLLASKIFDWLL